MPIYWYICQVCGEEVRKMHPRKATPGLCQCGGGLSRAPRGPSASPTEVLDGGLLLRRIERPADAERLTRERSEKRKRDLGILPSDSGPTVDMKKR